MKRLALGLILALSLTAIGCEEDVNLSRCGVPCFEADDEYRNVGACRPGYTTCSSTGAVTGCVGQSTPTPELCDLIDNDCDNEVDEEPTDPLLFPRHQSCGSAVGECELGTYACTSTGGIVCAGDQGPTPEDCNGLDNNCNGTVDDVQLELQDAFCWTHPIEDAWQHAPCRAGLKKCIAGGWNCPTFGAGAQVWPDTTDVCGDHIDNDCNGIIDDVPTSTYTPPLVDIVFVIDRSGSMQCCMGNVRTAVTAFVTGEGSDERFRYWFIDLPGSGYTVAQPNTTCSPPGLPVLGCDAATARITAGQLDALHGGHENSWDAFLNIIEGTAPLDLAWRDESLRFIVFFGDEPARSQQPNATEAVIIAAISNSDIQFHGFVNQVSSYFHGGTTYQTWQDYDGIATASGGALHDVRTPSVTLIQIFEEIVPPVCGGM